MIVCKVSYNYWFISSTFPFFCDFPSKGFGTRRLGLKQHCSRHTSCHGDVKIFETKMLAAFIKQVGPAIQESCDHSLLGRR